MSPAGQCPHPEKRRWPLLDDQEGPRCQCGHTWEPYLFARRVNQRLDRTVGGRMVVYRCHVDGVELDHLHTTDQEKFERRWAIDHLDEPVKDAVSSTPDIQKPGWNRKRRSRPTTRTERDRLRRHRRM